LWRLVGGEMTTILEIVVLVAIVAGGIYYFTKRK
jgi:hypothetical protein